jgi:hypothetical protein
VDWLDPVDLADCSKLGFRLRETLLLLNSKCHLFQDRGLWRVRRSNSDFGSLWRVRGRGKERVGRESVASKRGGKERARELCKIDLDVPGAGEFLFLHILP